MSDCPELSPLGAALRLLFKGRALHEIVTALHESPSFLQRDVAMARLAYFLLEELSVRPAAPVSSDLHAAREKAMNATRGFANALMLAHKAHHDLANHTDAGRM